MAKTASWIFGVIFIIAGAWGFFAQPALGFIAADMTTSIIHVVLGIVLLIMASKPSAGMTLKVVGIIYVLWAVLGFLGWNPGTIDGTTTWFYLIIGVIVAVLGWTCKSGTGMSSNAPAAPQM